jgi:hypothetical protein
MFFHGFLRYPGKGSTESLGNEVQLTFFFAFAASQQISRRQRCDSFSDHNPRTASVCSPISLLKSTFILFTFNLLHARLSSSRPLPIHQGRPRAGLFAPPIEDIICTTVQRHTL